jgi:signal peptidase I
MSIDTRKVENFSIEQPEGTETPPAGPPAPKTGSKVKEFFIEVAKIVIIALAIIIPVRFFVVQPFVVDGGSMLPTFRDGEYLIIDEISYRLGEPQRGDVVVFRSPQNSSVYYIKRIVGLPNETIKVEDGQVSIVNENNPAGIALEESAYLPDFRSTPGFVETELGPDEYFVLGDNRFASSDSRVFGAVPSKNIIGRAWVRGYPFDVITRFETPSYSGVE